MKHIRKFNENVDMTVEEIIDVLVEEHNAEITKGEFYYSVTIWDKTAGCYQDLEEMVYTSEQPIPDSFFNLSRLIDKL